MRRCPATKNSLVLENLFSAAHDAAFEKAVLLGGVEEVLPISFVNEVRDIQGRGRILLRLHTKAIENGVLLTDPNFYIPSNMRDPGSQNRRKALLVKLLMTMMFEQE